MIRIGIHLGRGYQVLLWSFLLLRRNQTDGIRWALRDRGDCWWISQHRNGCCQWCQQLVEEVVFVRTVYVPWLSRELLWKEKNIVFRIQLQTTKLSFFSSNKDKTPLLSDSNVIYQFSCPACCSSYIGKTESTLFNRTREHAWTDQKSAINKHFNTCLAWKHIAGLFEIETEEGINKREFQINTVRQNTKIIKRSDNWLKLAYQESLAIKEQKPALNNGIKSCKELALF